MLLWDEYKAIHPEGLQYSQFCNRYRSWSGKLDLVMRQNHRAGEKLFVDYAGQTVPITCSVTGKIRHAEIFVATLGASNYTHAEATWTQALPDWIASAILPARVRRPKDKAVVVENSVLVVERWILARLRHNTFFSLQELNAAIRQLLTPG